MKKEILYFCTFGIISIGIGALVLPWSRSYLRIMSEDHRIEEGDSRQRSSFSSENSLVFNGSTSRLPTAAPKPQIMVKEPPKILPQIEFKDLSEDPAPLLGGKEYTIQWKPIPEAIAYTVILSIDDPPQSLKIKTKRNQVTLVKTVENSGAKDKNLQVLVIGHLKDGTDSEKSRIVHLQVKPNAPDPSLISIKSTVIEEPKIQQIIIEE